jgi:hypothetical protein
MKDKDLVKAVATCLRVVATKAWLEVLVRYARLMGARGFAVWAASPLVRGARRVGWGRGRRGDRGRQRQVLPGWRGGTGAAAGLLRAGMRWQMVITLVRLPLDTCMFRF